MYCKDHQKKVLKLARHKLPFFASKEKGESGCINLKKFQEAVNENLKKVTKMRKSQENCSN